MDMVTAKGLTTVPSAEVFFGRLRTFLTKEEVKRVQKAWNFNERAHAHQLRDDRTPYSKHPIMVAWILVTIFNITDVDIIIWALIHDVLEIKKPRLHITRANIRVELGGTIEVGTHALAQKHHGKGKKEAKAHYVARMVRAGWKVMLVKFADRLHNVVTLNNCKLEKRVRKYEETKKYYLTSFLAALEKDLPAEMAWIVPKMEELMNQGLAQVDLVTPDP